MIDLMSRDHAVRFLRDHGFSLPTQREEAHQWCLQRASEGQVEAQCVVSTLYWTGMTGHEDQHEGFAWCERAATSGSLDAKCALAKYLISGIGGDKDPERGVRMLQELVEVEHLPSMVALGLLMLSGESGAIPVDRSAAIDLLIGPAEAGDPLSRCLIGAELILSSDKAVQLAGRKWIQLAADDGYPMAHRYIASFYRSGDHGFPVDTEKAQLHEALAEQLDNSAA